MNDQSNQFRGLILGTAVGDALGLPAEGLSPETIKKLGWSNWKHRFVFGKGMVSDDTEHTLFVCQALLCYPDNAKRFKVSLAWKLRWWLLALPAGIGFGTLIPLSSNISVVNIPQSPEVDDMVISHVTNVAQVEEALNTRSL